MYGSGHPPGSGGGRSGDRLPSRDDCGPHPPSTAELTAYGSVDSASGASVSPQYGYGGYYGYPGYTQYGVPTASYADASAVQPPAPPAPPGDPSSAAAAAPSAESQLESVQRCHMHTKPDLNCKFCRKYKSAVHELSRLAAQQGNAQSGDRPNQIAMTNCSTFNLNTLLRNNILNSEYYKSLATMSSHVDIMDELVQYADHAGPYCSTATRAPSTLFCCLHKLFTLRLTEKQMESLLDCPKSPYPRCCGFLYLRFVLPSDQLWDWFEPYFMDDEPFVVSINPKRETTIGEFCEQLLVEDKYFNTVLPRLPMRFKNQHGAQLCEMGAHRRRRAHNLRDIDQFSAGKAVSACIRGEWVDAVVQSVGSDYPEVTLLMPGGEEESVDIAYVSLVKPRPASEKRRRESDSGSGRRRSRSPPSPVSHHRSRAEEGACRVSGSRDDLLREFKRRQSEKALAVGKDYAKRPTSYKSSLSSRMDSKRGR